jgi:hypothetical protein
MTGEELARLPVGTLLNYDSNIGEIIQAGNEVHVMWDGGGTTIMRPASPAWQELVQHFKVEEL